jgi:hypothetical protein
MCLARRPAKIVADAKEQVDDIIAEVDAEGHVPRAASKSTAEVSPG